MPSRVEGLGLVVLEAIAAATPVLVSAKSGAAELLRELLGPLAEPMIVDIHDDLHRDTTAWTAAIEHILRDLPAALRYADQIRDRLASQLKWGDTVATLMHAPATSSAAAS